MKILPTNLFTVSALILSGFSLLSGTRQALKSDQIFSDLFIAQSSSRSISALCSGFDYATGTLFNYIFVGFRLFFCSYAK
uniref:Uncharacterized protein n=1 Tax=Gloeothece verrucosa (strain PCC 7822) TaxID=497965 RepID=E0UMG4_GLOV7|nr:conserved hypothetical protein [Gloeothece verrucosa PCC 7822]